MRVEVIKPDFSNIDKIEAEVLALGVFAGKNDGAEVKGADRLTDGSISRFLEKNKKFGKAYQKAEFYISPNRHKFIEKIVLVGLGSEDAVDNWKVRLIGAFIGKNVVKNYQKVAVYIPDLKTKETIRLLTVGFCSGIFDPGHHKKPSEDKKSVKELTILSNFDGKVAKSQVEEALTLCSTLDWVREVVNKPANIITPEYMVGVAKKIATENKLKIEVYSEKQVNDMGMGIMASVARGSDEDLYFVVLRYLGGGSSAKSLALVGKGITFDSGGISIKPSDSMEWMKMDMAGAATVLGAIEVIAKLKLPINVICAMPLTENLPSGKATKPGDVVKGLSGKTVEVINTDAEGRLVLADALTYVQEKYKPSHIVDVATLTGAAVVALGTLATAVLGRPKSFTDLVLETAELSGERVWPLPLYDEYRDLMKSYIADIANVSSTRWGGTETAAKFLEEFVEKKVNWAHLDIAPNAWEESDKPFASKGATGAMITTLVDLAKKLSEGKK